MGEIIIKNILELIDGKLVIGDKDSVLGEFEKDSRIVKKDDVYIGLRGEKYDGSAFWREALNNGAKTVIIADVNISDLDLEEYNKQNKNIIIVEDTQIALLKLAKYKRSLYDIPVVAITGSVGKTSTKDLVASVLETKYKTLKTEGNMNNHIGLPLTILRLKDHEVAVLEMGMNHLEEISLLALIANPTIAIITNIGTAHIGNLKTRENILKAKLEILDGKNVKHLIINKDNDLLLKWYREKRKDGFEKYNSLKIHTFSTYYKSDFKALNIESKENKSKFEYKGTNIEVPVAGEHFVLNSMPSIAVGEILNIDLENIKQGIEKFELTKKRMEIDVLDSGITIINDSYNASVESMEASISNLSKYKEKRKIAVLGDMFELGEFSGILHRKVGEEVKKQNIDILICHGKGAINIVNGAINSGMNLNNVYYAEMRNELLETLKNIVKKDDVILFKASNGMKFFEIVNNAKELLN